MSDFLVEWVDAGPEPQCAPNPKYPDGIDLDGTAGREPFCYMALPYPARRCGHFVLRCRTCKMSVVVTTAGRPDDPAQCEGAMPSKRIGGVI